MIKKKILQNRKIDHINICLKKYVESKKNTSRFEDITLIHRSFPEIDINDINLSTKFLNKKFSYPFLIASITGGSKKSMIINKNLALASEELNIGMGIGSQRITLIDKTNIESFSIVRDYAPTSFIYANIGISEI